MTNPSKPNNATLRAKSQEIDDSGKQQLVKGSGRNGEQLGGTKPQMPRAQNYGFSNFPPKGSIGLIVTPTGNLDAAMMGSMEHPDHRPTGLAEGEWKQYDMWGQYLHAKEGRWELNVGTLTIIADQVVIQSSDINLGGLGGKKVAVEGTVDSAGDFLVDNFCATVKAV